MSNYREEKSLNIGDLIEKLLSTGRLKSKYQEAKIVLAWHKIVGDYVSKQCKSVYFSGKTLYVQADSAVLKAELSMQKHRLIESINTEMNEEVVQRLIFK